MTFIKKSILLLLTSSVLLACGTQQEATTEKQDKRRTERMVLDNSLTPQIASEQTAQATLIGISLGEVDGLQAFMNGETQSWFAPRYNQYSPDREILASLEDLKDDVTIRGYMGTWCGDSKRETPRLYKILSEIGYDMSKLTMISVDRSKQRPTELVEGYNIFRVPTFIFYRDGEEIGRFVERDRNMSLEAAMQKIWSGQPYKHAYAK